MSDITCQHIDYMALCDKQRRICSTQMTSLILTVDGAQCSEIVEVQLEQLMNRAGLSVL